MDNAINVLFSYQFILFCLGVFGVTYIIRLCVEFFGKDKVKGSKLWTELVLPLMPLVTGILISIFAKKYPYPDGIHELGAGRVMFGMCAGLFSGLAYRAVKSMISSKISSADKESTPINDVVADANKVEDPKN